MNSMLPHSPRLTRQLRTICSPALAAAAVFWGAGCAGSAQQAGSGAGDAPTAKTPAIGTGLRHQAMKSETETPEASQAAESAGAKPDASMPEDTPVVIPDVPTNDQSKLNPVMRSWQFTSEKDYVVYRVLGEPSFDQEIRVSLGERDGRHRYVIQRRFRGEPIGQKEVQEFPVDPNLSGVSLASRMIARGYRSQTEWLGRGDQVFPTLYLSHPTLGQSTYSEDVPLGGLVASEDSKSGVSYTLLKFERAQTPPPSQIILEREASTSSGSIGGIDRIRPDAEKQEYTPQIKEVGNWVREDADTVPAYFRPRGEKTERLDHSGWVLGMRFHLPFSVATWQVENFAMREIKLETGGSAAGAAEEPKPEYSYEIRIQTEELPEPGKQKVSEKISNVVGTPPDGIVEGARGVIYDLKSPLMPGVEHQVFREAKNLTMKLGIKEYDTTPFSIYETPVIERTKLDDGSEEQDIHRTLHRLWIDLRSSQEPLLVRRETTVFHYWQRSDPRGLLVESKHEESKYVEMLKNLWTPPDRAMLDPNRVPVE